MKRRWTQLWVLAILGGSVLLGCKSQEQKRCEQLVKTTEVTLLSMNPTDLASIESTLAELEKTRAACLLAKSKDVGEIDTALANVKKHLLRVQSGEVKPPPPPPGAAELAKLEKEGDPDCPKGQGYQHPVLNKFIRCKGPIMIQRNYEQVKAYFEKHRIVAAAKDAMLRGTQAGVTYTFSFTAAGSQDGPVCLTLESGKDKKDVELIAFATNIQPAKIDPTQPVTVQGVTIPLVVKREGEQQTIVLGDCSKGAPMLPTADAPAPAPSASAGPASSGGVGDGRAP